MNNARVRSDAHAEPRSNATMIERARVSCRTQAIVRSDAMWSRVWHSGPTHLFHHFLEHNFTTLAQMCQPSSVSPCARVLAYFHKCFQKDLSLNFHRHSILAMMQS
jgi:hypothetical protein